MTGMANAAPLKPLFCAAVLLTIAVTSVALTSKGALIMTSSVGSGAAQGDTQGVALRPLPIDGAEAIDGLQLVETAGKLTLLYSTQTEAPSGEYELVINAAPIANPAARIEVARIGRLLPPTPQWDARPVGDRYEIVYDEAGGAVNEIHHRDVEGNVTRLSTQHPYESFSRPHFVRSPAGTGTEDVGAVVDLKKVVVFPGGTTTPVKYVVLADGTDGIVGTLQNRWVAAKNSMSGLTLFDTLPGRLTLTRVGDTDGDTRSSIVPDLLVYELDAAALGSDVVVFATGKPAVLVLGARPHRPYRLGAENRSWLSQLSEPTMLITPQALHLAAIANPGSDRAIILYGSVPISALAQ
jgi:hypothetical protein